MTVHVCGRPAGPSCCAPGCGRRDTAPCQFELAGKKAGATCGKPVCEAHAKEAMPGSGRRLCPAHFALTVRRASG